MAAFGDATVTIDTGEMVYIDRKGNPLTVNDAQTFVFDLTERGTQVVYTVLTDTLTLTNGEKLIIESNDAFAQFTVDTDAVAKLNAGTIWFREPNGFLHPYDVTTITIDDIDEPTVITAATLTSQFRPMYSFTWTTVTVAQ